MDSKKAAIDPGGGTLIPMASDIIPPRKRSVEWRTAGDSKNQINSNKLPKRLLADASSALVASATIAPAVTIIDRYAPCFN